MTKIFNIFAQVALPALTIGGQIATSMKYPEWGLIINMCAQPFWLYSSWKAWKSAGQLGMFINSVFFTIVTAFGIVNYWFI